MYEGDSGDTSAVKEPHHFEVKNLKARLGHPNSWTPRRTLLTSMMSSI